MKNFSELPPEWRNVKFLEEKHDQSKSLVTKFACVAAVAGIANVSINVRDDSQQMIQAHYATFACASVSLVFVVLGTAAIYRLKSLIRQGRDIEGGPK